MTVPMPQNRVLCLTLANGLPFYLVALVGLALLPIWGLQAQADVHTDYRELRQAVAEAVKSGRISGATIVVADAAGNGPIYAYGVRDADGGAIDGPRDQFLIASITKTMTAIAVLQLVDRGVIASLDDPANKYLKRTQLTDWNGQPITIRHLLTHSSGLRTLSFGFITQAPLRSPMDAGQVKARTPDTIRQPGENVVYSNAGFALLGMIVEDQSGTDFAAYLRDNLFAPLGMENTYLNYAVRPSDEMVRALNVTTAGAFEPIAFDVNVPFMAPAGSVVTSGSDMQRYMAFLLNRGAGKSGDILSPRLFSQAFTPQMRNHPLAQGMGLGFFLGTDPAAPLINHTGAFAGYTSYFAVSPKRGRGIYLVTAGSGSENTFAAFAEGADIIDAALGPRTQHLYMMSRLDRAGELAGTYLPAQRFSKGVPRLLGLQNSIRVNVDPDGWLRIDGSGPMGVIAIGVIGELKDGAIVKAYGYSLDPQPMLTMNTDIATKASPFERIEVLLGLLGAGCLLIALGLLCAIGTGLLKRKGFMIPATAAVGAVAAIAATLTTNFPTRSPLTFDMVSGNLWRLYIVNGLSWTIIVALIVLLVSMFLRRDAAHRKRALVSQVSMASGISALCAFVTLSGLADPGML